MQGTAYRPWSFVTADGVAFLGFLVFLLRYLIGPRLSGGAKSGSVTDLRNETAAPAAGGPAPKDDMDSRLAEELDSLEN